MARRAGMKVAMEATANRNNGTETNAIGSCAPSPNIMLESTPETAPHKTTPTVPPIRTGRNACHSTCLMTFALFAPRAIRMPISRTERFTLYDTIPYTPIEHRNSANTPSVPEMPVTIRDGARQTSR
jgi:hypothetical protein